MPTDVGGPRVRALLALCALEPGRPVPFARLVDALWGEEPPENAANALQTLVKRLRAVCGREAVARHAGGYALLIEPGDVDAHRFAELVRTARREAADAAFDRAAATLVQALGEWAGPALAGLTGFPRLATAAVALEDLRLDAVELLADCRLALGRAEESIADLTAEVAAHPLREPLAARLMTALSAAGRRSEALTRFQDIRQALADELGVYPSAELAAVHADLLRLDTAHAVAAQPSRPPTNLPRPLTSFVGRDAEVGTISRLLEDHSLITLTGPGGTGKTRLALETAARLSGGHPDGVWLVELAAVAGSERLGGAVRGAIGVASGGGVGVGSGGGGGNDKDSAAAVADALADRRALLVIDNCEHLLDAVAALVHTILQRCPGIRILATSREPLDVPGEHLLPVLPLLESAAVQLFADRAAQSRPGFKLDAANCAAVCTICRDLDGIRADTIFVVGGGAQPLADDRLGSVLRQAAAAGRRIVGVCTGVFVLAQAGLLDGLRATTHWHVMDRLARDFPQIKVERDALYVADEPVLTSAGAAAVVELCLHLIRTDHGTAAAATAGSLAVAGPARPAGQPQPAAPLWSPGADRTLAATRQWAQSHLHAPITLADLAAHATVSERTLTRRFHTETGLSPLQWLLHQRIDLARQLLERTDLTMDGVAHRSGLGSPDSLRRHFVARLGLTPSAYRARWRVPVEAV